MGASSRVLANAEITPDTGPSETSSRAVYASMPMEAPIAAPMMSMTGAVPPPTMREPRPQVMSVIVDIVWRR